MLLPERMDEILPPEHLAWFVIETVSELDLSVFFAGYRADGHGRAAHDPEMMVALLLYAYATGTRSAREIERRCTDDLAYRVIAAARRPDHATIARFRSRHQEPLAELFGQLLGLCNRAGIVSGELLALDSTKLAANASGQRNRSYRQIAEEILADAERVDAEEDALHGEARGDEMPSHLRDPKARREWIREQLRSPDKPDASEPNKRAEALQRAKRKLEDEHQARLDAETEKAEWRRAREAELAAEGKKMRGRPPTRKPLGAEPQGRVNITDPDSRPMKTPRGFIQGYNAQAVATKEQVIVSCELAPGTLDQGPLEPMLDSAKENLAAIGAAGPETILADAGYWSPAQIERLGDLGIEALVPPMLTRARDPGRASGPRAGSECGRSSRASEAETSTASARASSSRSSPRPR